MTIKTAHAIFKISGILIMLFAFLVVSETKPWHCIVLLFDVGLLLVLIPKISNTKTRASKIKESL